MRYLLGWIFRFALAALGFCAVWFGLPFLLGLAAITWPAPVVLILALLVAAGILYFWTYGRRAAAPPVV